MGYKEANLFGIPAKIYRISFSGELAYEVNVGQTLVISCGKIIKVGKEFQIQPYGTEAFLL